MTTESDPGMRMYGNWRKARGLGIGQLSTAQTTALFVAALATVLCTFISPIVALGAVVVAALVAAAVLVRIDGQSLVDAMGRRVRFRSAARGGLLERSGGLLMDRPRHAALPGPMAALVPLSTDDGRGGRQCLMWDRGSDYLTAVIRVAPVGLALADRGQADLWVAGWGSFLADLGYHRMVRHVTVTVDTTPSGGTTVRDHVAERMDPNAPAGARQVLNELVASSPAVSADTDCWVSLTFDPKRASPEPEDLLGKVAEVTRWLPTLENRLASTGIAVLGRADVEWITHRLRVAYDPASRTDHDEPSIDDVQRWSDAGPVAARETWDWWQHDSGTSVSWGMAEAPRQAVSDRVLIPLLSPGRWPRRVTLLFEPFAADDAAKQVEQQVTAAQFRRGWAARTRRDPTQRDADDQARALQAAREEATGAGVLNFFLYVTTTVLDETSLPAATADVEQRAGACKIRLRRLRGSQNAAFATSLGMGISPADLARRHA